VRCASRVRTSLVFWLAVCRSPLAPHSLVLDSMHDNICDSPIILASLFLFFSLFLLPSVGFCVFGVLIEGVGGVAYGCVWVQIGVSAHKEHPGGTGASSPPTTNTWLLCDREPAQTEHAMTLIPGNILFGQGTLNHMDEIRLIRDGPRLSFLLNGIPQVCLCGSVCVEEREVRVCVCV